MASVKEIEDMERNCHYLPEDVVENILLRLPVKSLIRFKRVCKSWYALINDRSFADNHLKFSKKFSQSSPSLFLYYIERYCWPPQNEHSGLITIYDKDDNDCIPYVFEDLNLSRILGTLGQDDTCVWTGSHCNGIIMLTTLRSKETVFYNPAIGDFKPLPTRLLPHGFEVRGVGLGYDSKENDHKFVRISNSLKTKENIAEVYTLGSDCWKQIKIETELGASDAFWNPVLTCKGVYFWLVQPVYTFLSLDMSTDEFRNIPLPDSMQRVKDLFMRDFVWNESITILFRRDRRAEPSFEMWVMDYYSCGVEGPSWTKHLIIEPVVWIGRPIIFWKSDELLMNTEDEQLVSYNLGTKKIRYLPLRKTKPGVWLADFYLPSLVPVSARN